ncbi:hypothetical protein GCM10009555_038500 [Acrocarpospora macrocephala]|uniref:Uncharacterized protein n=1 Tax=Acrocarpospora macrocephala TaxID=150177 RepID=A0A5M3WM74_9ACTN|nr:hypothetical protein [Acrocarpospora macrocephala]GES09736.1 hypothetical protein Amac_033320 [Acrocarpospora macrocephala]
MTVNDTAFNVLAPSDPMVGEVAAIEDAVHVEDAKVDESMDSGHHRCSP